MSSRDGIDRNAVAAAVGIGLADRVVDRTTEVVPVPVPGLGDEVVWRVQDAEIDHPIEVYVGHWPDGTVQVLSDNQPAFLALVQAVGVDLRAAETALGYVRAFLEVTRGPAVIMRIVSDIDDVMWRPGSPDEESRREAFVADRPITPPRVEPTAQGFHVELCLVVNQRIQRNTFEVTHDGSISASFSVLAEDLPLPIAW